MKRFKEYLSEAVTLDMSGFDKAFPKYLNEVGTFFTTLGFTPPNVKVKLINNKIAMSNPILKTQPTSYANGVVMMRADYYGALMNGTDTAHLLVYECGKNVAQNSIGKTAVDAKTIENFAITCQLYFCRKRGLKLPQILNSPYLTTMKKDRNRDYNGAWVNPKKYVDLIKQNTPMGNKAKTVAGQVAGQAGKAIAGGVKNLANKAGQAIQNKAGEVAQNLKTGALNTLKTSLGIKGNQ